MPLSHVLCNVESFRITRDGHGVFGDEVRAQGWFLSHAPLQRLEIVFGEDIVVPVDQTGLESEGVWQHHGASFGEAARRCRFYTARKVPEHGIEQASARLRAVTAREVHELSLGPPERTEAVERFTPEESALVMGFESLGDNCEFGLVQRSVGIERMALLRYAGVSDVMRLADLLERRFEGFCEGGDLRISTFGAEWIADVVSPGINVHTGRIQGLVSREKIEAEERLKLQFLAGKLMDDLEAGEKMFVYRTVAGERGGPDGLHGMDRLYAAIRSYGDCALLWVSLADDAHPHGSVTHVRDRLYRGRIRQLAPYADAHAGDERAWLDLLASARAAMSRRPALAGARVDATRVDATRVDASLGDP